MRLSYADDLVDESALHSRRTGRIDSRRFLIANHDDIARCVRSRGAKQIGITGVESSERNVTTLTAIQRIDAFLFLSQDDVL